MIEGERGQGVDIHTHVVPEHFPRYVGRSLEPRWPEMVAADACHRHVMLSGKVYRTVSDRCWECAKRAMDMHEQRIGRQVLSVMPELLSYWLDPEDGISLSRYLNEQIAEMVHSMPDRFYGLATVPLQNVDIAVRELESVRTQLGLSGIEIGTNVNGTPLGAPALDPFFAAAERLDMAVFVHPLRPSGAERLVGPAALNQVLAFPGETGLAAASLITSGVLSRYPKLRIAFSHGGGTLASLLPRLQHGWTRIPALKESIPVSPEQVARSMYYDSLVYDAPTLRRLVECFGETQVCVGSDFPFRIREHDPVGRIEEAGLSPSAQQLVLSENALRWLGIVDRT